MKVTRLRTALANVPFTPPIDGGPIMLRSAGCVLVFLETDDGAVGEGVAFVLNAVRLKVIHELILSLGPLIVGTDVAASDDFTMRAWRDLTFIGHAGVSMIGLSAVEGALWDLRAKAERLNIAQWLGPCRTAVPVYHSGGLWISRSVDELQREANDFVSRGYRAIKMRVGRFATDVDIARVRAVREAIGPNIALMADANQQLGVDQAIRLGRGIEEFNLTWLEEPVHYLDHAGEAAVAAALDTPIASGETEYTSRGMQEMLRLRGADILMPDLQRMGGPNEFIRAAQLAERHNVPVSAHLFPEMSLSLLAAIPNATYLEYMPWLEPLYRERFALDDAGRAVVPDRPGWGFSFDPAAIKTFAMTW